MGLKQVPVWHTRKFKWWPWPSCTQRAEPYSIYCPYVESLLSIFNPFSQTGNRSPDLAETNLRESSVGGPRRLGGPEEHAPTMPPRGPVTGPPYRHRSTVLSVLLCIKEKAPDYSHSTVRRTCFHMLQQALMPGHSVEEPAHPRPLCAQIVCCHASLRSEPTA